MEVKKETFKEGTSDEFTISYINVKGEKYRVPTSVLASLKVILEEKPDTTKFKVAKTGSGMSTTYQVIGL